MSMRFIAGLLLLASLYGAWDAWRDRPFTPPAGVLAADAPQQRDLEMPKSIAIRGVTLEQRARYDLTVRLLRKERYHIDGAASIAPWDLAVGWGPMSDSNILEQLEITQSGRFFYWRSRDPAHFPISAHDLVASAGQIHAIPADATVESQLANVRRGQILTLHGYLVDVHGPRGFRWNTSLSRNDSGDGACEIMWIEAIEVH